MITKQDLKELSERKSIQGSPTLSIYLDVDQSNSANLNRKFEVALSNALREVGEALVGPQHKDFEEDAFRALE